MAFNLPKLPKGRYYIGQAAKKKNTYPRFLYRKIAEGKLPCEETDIKLKTVTLEDVEKCLK